jgi:hypothetical protein
MSRQSGYQEVKILRNILAESSTRLNTLKYIINNNLPEFCPKTLLRQASLRVFQFSPVSIIPSMLHTHFLPRVALTRWTNGRSLGTFQEQCSFGNRGALDRKVIFISSLNG